MATEKAAAKRRAADVSAEVDRMAGGRIAIEGLSADDLYDVECVSEHPKNPRDGDIGAIIESIEAHGIYRRLIVQRETPQGEPRMLVVAGNHTRRAAMQLGYRMLPMEFIVCSDAKAKKILLVDNRSNDRASYDNNALVELLEEVVGEPDGLTGTGYDGDDLDELRDLLGLNDKGGTGGDPDDADVSVPKVAKSVPGEVYRLGRHRLMCGDALVAADVDRLLAGVKPDMAFCDPPYGVKIVSEDDDETRGKVGRISRGMKAKAITEQRGDYDPIIGDDTTDTAVGGYLACVARKIKVLIFWGGNYYADRLPPSSCWIVWDKDNGESFFADAELAWTNQKTAVRIFKHEWNGLIKGSERGERRVHPTQKPVVLAEWCFEKYGKDGDVVLDLFGGSGMSMIAGERTGRTVYMMEKSPAYCDVIRRRYAEYVGDEGLLP